MKYINLNGQYGKGLRVLVSDEDFDMVSKYRWYGHPDHNCPKNIYARRYEHSKSFYLHRELIGDKKGLVVDHINRNTLDNRRENLRHITHKENSRNRPSQLGTGKGATKVGSKWVASVNYQHKSYYLGTFLTQEEAREKYVAFCKKIQSLGLGD